MRPARKPNRTEAALAERLAVRYGAKLWPGEITTTEIVRTAYDHGGTVNPGVFDDLKAIRKRVLEDTGADVLDALAAIYWPARSGAIHARDYHPHWIRTVNEVARILQRHGREAEPIPQPLPRR